MIRKKKLYEKPKKSFQASRIAEENELVKRYALKNKREIWKTQSKINYFRGRAKALARASSEEQEVLFNKLKAIGLNINTTADVLDLKVENLLERRLPTIVAKQNLANTPRHARQLVVHKKIIVDGRVINSPSYIVPIDKEKKIKLKEKKKTLKPKTPDKQEQPKEKTEVPDTAEQNPLDNQENKEEAK